MFRETLVHDARLLEFKMSGTTIRLGTLLSSVPLSSFVLRLFFFTHSLVSFVKRQTKGTNEPGKRNQHQDLLEIDYRL